MYSQQYGPEKRVYLRPISVLLLHHYKQPETCSYSSPGMNKFHLQPCIQRGAMCYENENCTWCSYIYVSNQPVKKAGHQSKGQGHRSSA